MYLGIPLMFIAGLALGIFLIIFRKFPYLKKLPIDPEQKVSGTFLADFFPEVYGRFKKINWVSYRTYFLRESEKFFRRLHVFSLKLESFSSSLTNKIKTSYHRHSHEQNLTPEPTAPGGEPAKIIFGELPLDHKKEEQGLILEIARDPKNPELYRRLADIYLAMKNFMDAKESLETALKLDPDDEKTKEKLAKILVMPAKIKT